MINVLKLNIKYVETLKHTLTAGELTHIQSLCGHMSRKHAWKPNALAASGQTHSPFVGFVLFSSPQL